MQINIPSEPHTWKEILTMIANDMVIMGSTLTCSPYDQPGYSKESRAIEKETTVPTDLYQ
jgi:hypothetical protein